MKNFVLLTVVLAISFLQTSEALIRKTRPSADAYIDNYNTNTNYGSLTSAWHFSEINPDTGLGTGRKDALLVKYNITQLTPNITSARDYHKQTFTAGIEFYSPYIVFNLDRVSCDWNETTVTWNTQPGVISSIATDYQDNDNEWVIGSFASQLKSAKLAGDSVFCLRYTSNYDLLETYTKEADLPDAPYLETVE